MLVLWGSYAQGMRAPGHGPQTMPPWIELRRYPVDDHRSAELSTSFIINRFIGSQEIGNNRRHPLDNSYCWDAHIKRRYRVATELATHIEVMSSVRTALLTSDCPEVHPGSQSYDLTP